MSGAKKVAIYMNLTELHHQGIAKGVLRYAREHDGWQIFGTYWPMLAVDDFRNWRGDGIIADVQTRADVDLLTAADIPVVDIAGALRDPRLSLVTNDNVATGRLAAMHFLENGFSSFAFCGSENSMWSEERLTGFAQGLAEADFVPSVFRKKHAWWYASRMSQALGKWLAKEKRPVGVFAANDIIGMNVVGACRLARLRIPEDVALVGVDNEEMLCELSTPPMSSFPFNRLEIGTRAAERLDALMSGRTMSRAAVRVEVMPLIVRASSMTLVLSDPLIGEVLSFIRKNAANFLDVHSVAEAFNTSRRSLERHFRAQIGHTLLEEIHQVRIKEAKRMLRDTNLPLVKVSLRCGFKTHNRFNMTFKKYTGVLPKEYRLRRLNRSERDAAG